ncbi:MAG: Do family serine endopeptidase [Betaproteobacteria bacterium]|jgi:serine protease DegQ|nr:MAG: Do family serine endopeptidase [Betaproteobacteria bacterium]
MRKFWLVFSQAVTICLAVLFVITTFRPKLLGVTPHSPAGEVVTIREAESRPVRDINLGSLKLAAQKAMPAVVNVYTSKQNKLPRHPIMDDPLFRRFFGDPFDEQSRQSTSLGSGVIVGPQGYVLTNNHVIETADEIEVAFAGGRKAPAAVVGTDPETDLAVLKVDKAELPSIAFGNPESLSVGDFVLAIGNPFGLGQTVTMGIVSAKGRRRLGISTFEDFIQTDAAINQGNSGGALVDAAGNLVGINSAIYSRTGGSLGIGFAIPSDLARHVMEEIIENGSVTRGWIGVEVQDITPELAESFRLPTTNGTLIASVQPGGPAQRAGIRPGDILVAVEAQEFTDAPEMLQLIAALEPGDKATLKILRDREEKLVQIEVGIRPRPISHRSPE